MVFLFAFSIRFSVFLPPFSHQHRPTVFPISIGRAHNPPSPLFS